jgi:hypothetical protein
MQTPKTWSDMPESSRSILPFLAMTQNRFSESLMNPTPRKTPSKHLPVQQSAPSPASVNSGMRAVGIAATCLAVFFLGNECKAQTLTAAYSNVTRNYQLEGRILRFDFHDANNLGGGDNSGEIDISELDLDAAEVGEIAAVPGLYEANLACKQQNSCVQMRHSGGMHWDDAPGQSVISQPYLELDCNSQQACVDFLNAMKNALAPKPASPQVGGPQSAPGALPAVVPASVPRPVVRTPAPAGSGLHDLLANIAWLSGNGSTPPGKSALDNLVQTIKPTQDPAPKPPRVQHPTFAAFSQAGGFDANGAWGAGTGTDLNSAIGAAGNTCHQGATICDDEGYCALRPGLWGAWASDLKVAGNSAFTCNVATEDEARAQAQAWCGDACKVLWSGAGQ